MPEDLYLNCCFANFSLEKQHIIGENSCQVDHFLVVLPPGPTISDVAGWYLRWQRTLLDVGPLSTFREVVVGP